MRVLTLFTMIFHSLLGTRVLSAGLLTFQTYKRNKLKTVEGYDITIKNSLMLKLLLFFNHCNSTNFIPSSAAMHDRTSVPPLFASIRVWWILHCCPAACQSPAKHDTLSLCVPYTCGMVLKHKSCRKPLLKMF